MKYNYLPIGLGTAAIGRPQYINLRQEQTQAFELESFKAAGRAVLDEAYAQGIRYFDTAPGYGLAEQLLIEWIDEKQHPDLEMATKWGYTYVANFQADALQHEIKEHSLSKLNEQWMQSQKLLPYLKGYQVHSATFDSGIFENTAALDRLWALKKEFGLMIGLTASGSDQVKIVKHALAIEREGQSLFELFQLTYNVLDQSIATLKDKLADLNKRVVIKEALANGRLFKNADYPAYEALYTYLESLAQKYSVGVDAVAIRFCLDSLEPYMVLSGASTPQHVSDNLKAMTFELTAEEVAELKSFAVATGSYWDERKKLSWK